MATKSFLKNITLKTNKQVGELVNALEKAKNFRGEEVKMSRSVNEVSREQIKNFAAKIRGIH